jgi:hypothetical protein
VGGNWKLETQTGNLSLAKACAERPRYHSLRGRTQKFVPLRSGPPQRFAKTRSENQNVRSREFRTHVRDFNI